MVRVFLDSSVLIAASASNKGASYAVILLGEMSLIKVVISTQVLEECERNLSKKLPKSIEIFHAIVSTLNPEVLPNPELEDINLLVNLIEPKDAPILGAALQGKVNCLLTLNTKDFTPEVAQKVDLKIKTPGQFIQELRELIVNSIQ